MHLLSFRFVCLEVKRASALCLLITHYLRTIERYGPLRDGLSLTVTPPQVRRRWSRNKVNEWGWHIGSKAWPSTESRHSMSTVHFASYDSDHVCPSLPKSNNGGGIGKQAVFLLLSSCSLQVIDERQHERKCRHVLAYCYSLEFLANIMSYPDLRCRSLCLSISYLCCTILGVIHDALI